jgi:hypothetical protein
MTVVETAIKHTAQEQQMPISYKFLIKKLREQKKIDFDLEDEETMHPHEDTQKLLNDVMQKFKVVDGIIILI